jgi:hypothetical protein
MRAFVIVFLVVGCAKPTAPAKPGGDKPTGKPTSLKSCSDSVGMTCGDKMVDGCTIKDASGATLTTDHTCVRPDAKPGAPCAQEITLTCETVDDYPGLVEPSKMVDGCLHRPPLSTTHVCVLGFYGGTP